MQEIENPITVTAKRTPWNKGKMTGAKPPLRPKHVWAIRTMLQNSRQARDLALFNLAIDSKLRGCRPVRFELTEQTPSFCLLVGVQGAA
jgi:hypothetical protein